MAVRLDRRRDWAQMEEAAKRHFHKRAVINATPVEKMASHPCDENVRNSGREYADLSRRDHAITWDARNEKCPVEEALKELSATKKPTKLVEPKYQKVVCSTRKRGSKHPGMRVS